MKLIESMETFAWFQDGEIPSSVSDIDVVAYLLTRNGYSRKEDAEEDGVAVKKVTFSVSISIKSVE